MRAGLCLSFFALLSGCAATDGDKPTTQASTASVTLSGTVAYRERIALPSDARVKVLLSDVDRMDAPAPVLAETEFGADGRQVPLPFTLSYDPAHIAPNGSYAVSARISDASGRLLWITDTRISLPPPGTPATLWLVQVRN